MQVDFFVLDRPPQSLSEDVVYGASATVHADLDLRVAQEIGVLWAIDVTALVVIANA